MAIVPLPKFPAGGSVTVHASAALTAGRCLAATATAPNGGNQVVAVPAAGATVIGVAGEDIASGAKGLMHKTGQYVWIECGGTVTAGDLVETTNTGAVITKSTGIPLGICVQGNTIGLFALIDLRPALIADAT